MGLLDGIFKNKKSELQHEMKLLKDERQQLQDVVNKYNEVFFQFMHTGIPISPKDNQMNYVNYGYQQNEDVYSITTKIATKCAMAPAILYEVIDDKALRQYKLLKTGTDIESKIASLQLQKKALKEISGTDIQKVWDNPNDDESNFEFQMKMYLFMLICGNQYIYGVDGVNKGLFYKLYNLPAHLTNIVGGDKFNPVKGYQCLWSNELFNFDKSEVKHIRYPGFDYDRAGGQLYGQSPLRVAIKNTISRMLANNEQLLKQMKNAGAVGFISNDQEKYDLKPAQAQELEEKITDRLKSDDQFGRIKVTNGKLSWQQIGFSTIELDLLNLANFDAKKICNIYGYPIQLYNSEEASTDNNMRWAAKNFVSNVVAPLHRQIDDALNKFFVEPYAKKMGKQLYMEHDIYSYPEMQEDMGELTEWLDKSWWIKPNDKLEMQRFGKSEDPAMEKVYIPSNLMPLDAVNINNEDFNNAFDNEK